ncbi:EAL domain-containing protein [Pollutimonas subterranea]|nr:EAL domain-containing protein [Pollutimonas subterranea]
MRLRLSSVSLRIRLLLLILVALLPAVAMLVYQGMQNYKQAHQNLEREAEYVAQQIVTFSKETFPRPDQYLANLASVPELQKPGAACDQFLGSTLKSSYSLDNLLVIQPDGNVACSGIPLKGPMNVSARHYFQRALASKTFAIGQLQQSRKGPQPLIVFAYPILDDKENVTRVLALAADLAWLNDSLGRAIKSSGRFLGVAASVVDSNGTLIAAAPHAHYVGQTVPDWETANLHLSRSKGLTRNEIWLDDIYRTTAYLPLYSSKTSTLYLKVGLPLAGPLAEARAGSIRNFALVGLGSLLALIAAWSLSNWLVSKPLGILSRTATKLGQGVMSARTGLGGSGGEIGALAHQFDTMATQLQQQHDALLRTGRVQAVRSATNSAMLRAHTEKDLLTDICRVIQQIGGYEFAWVGYAPNTSTDTLIAQAHCGVSDEIIADFCRTPWSQIPDPGPVTKAIWTGTVQVIPDLATKGPHSPWRTRVLAQGCASAIGLPLSVDHRIIGALGIFSSDPQAFGPDEIELLTATANDVSFGISALRTTNEVRRSQEFLELVINNMPSMVYVKDATDLRFVSMNPAGEALTGFREEDLVGKTDYDFFPKSEADYFTAKDREALAGSSRLSVSDEIITTKSGELKTLQTRKLSLLDDDGRPKYLLGISEDITEQKKNNAQLVYLATHDALTGLPKRVFLMEWLERALDRAKADGRSVTLMYLDLDGFKEVNDSLGHFTGDETLKTVGNLLVAKIPDAGIVARIAGDEFVIVLENITSKSQTIAAAKQLGRYFEAPIIVGGQEIFLTPGIGISVYPDDADTPDALLRTADFAMYQAKSGGSTYAFYSPNLEKRTSARLEMRNLLRHAIEKDELTLHYQPKVSVRTGKIIGAEALLRWNSRELGSISPAQFIPLAEESGLIVPIGEWVLRTACLQAMQWQRLGFPIVIAVNLSPRQFRQADLLEHIQLMLKETGLPPERLELEVTETAIMDNAASAIRLLNSIHEMGVQLSIDDFGTGYSSLAYLKQLPVSILKIDQSFVKGLTSEPDDAAIVTAVIAMAKSLHLAVTAEGVETAEQLDALAGLGCDNYQGYWFSRPQPADAFIALLETAP